VEGAKASKAAETGERPANSEVDDQVYASSAKSFRLEGSYEEPVTAVKRFSIPERIPYCVSAEPFAIVAAGESRPSERTVASSRDSEKESNRQKRWDDGKTGRARRPVDGNEPANLKRAAVKARGSDAGDRTNAKMMSGVPATGTFYIYAFDGRLLAEYDVLGQLAREYIYFGGMLVAEYRNQESRLLYYASDQINSTRIVTDNTGTVVYAAAHEPYGGIQKTWVSSYAPSLKFSGKQRDAESELDYFGARYYDRSLYRFLSVDPIISGRAALSNPQRWNQYAYCLGNPVNFVDPGGADPIKIEIVRKTWDWASGSCYGTIYVNGNCIGWTLENLHKRMVKDGTYGGTLGERANIYGDMFPVIMFDLKLVQFYLDSKSNIIKGNIGVKTVIPSILAGGSVKDLEGCIYVSYYMPENGETSGSVRAMNDLVNEISRLQGLIAEEFRAMGFAHQQGLLGGPIDQVLGMLDAMDHLSFMLGYWEDMLDAQKISIQIRHDI